MVGLRVERNVQMSARSSSVDKQKSSLSDEESIRTEFLEVL